MSKFIYLLSVWKNTVILRFLRCVNWFLKYCPQSLKRRVCSLQQTFLRAELRRRLAELPPTGLHSKRPQVAVFREFCEHVLNVFENSPRCICKNYALMILFRF